MGFNMGKMEDARKTEADEEAAAPGASTSSRRYSFLGHGCRGLGVASSILAAPTIRLGGLSAGQCRID